VVADRRDASIPRRAPNFPEECRFVLETLGEVYGYDEQARTLGMSTEDRLHFHQKHSGPVMEKLHTWCQVQFEERKVEPNSGLGQAIPYLLKHWENSPCSCECRARPSIIIWSLPLAAVTKLCRLPDYAASIDWPTPIREGSLTFVTALIGIITSSPEKPAGCLEAGSGQARVWMGWRVPMLVP
jgi:hypothetical protein